MLNKLRESLTTQLELLTKPLQTLEPDMITFLGLLASLSAAYFYSQATSFPAFYVLLGAFLLLVSGYLDVADGFVAKRQKTTTRFGALLDSVTDRYSDAAIVAGLILGGLADPLIGLIALIGFLLVSYVRARAESLGVNMVTVGFAERAERLIIIILASLIAAVTDPRLVMNLAVVLLAILTHFTVAQRMLYARRTLESAT